MSLNINSTDEQERLHAMIAVFAGEQFEDDPDKAEYLQNEIARAFTEDKNKGKIKKCGHN